MNTKNTGRDTGGTGATRDTGKIGYACVTVGVPGTSMRTCNRRFATEGRLLEIIAHNLEALKNQLTYNRARDILLFRISSDIVPFAGTPINTLDWTAIFGKEFNCLSNLILGSGFRVSMHPGQYTVLNSPDPGVVERAIADLMWHADFLDALGTSRESKIVLHVGGVYGDKSSAMKRFIGRYRLLPDKVRSRLVIENDERSFSVQDTLSIHDELGVPVVYDSFHREVFEGTRVESHRDLLQRCARTWAFGDGRQKIHYSQQEPEKRKGAHSETIRTDEFIKFFTSIRDIGPDIMLEVKDKNLSAVKCLHLIRGRAPHSRLEEEWSRYKYYVMERSPEIYASIRRLFSGSASPSPEDFYLFIEQAGDSEASVGRAENAALHVWGYFSDRAEDREKKEFFKRLEACRDGQASIESVKKYLFRLAERYDERYLLQSLYFYL